MTTVKGTARIYLRIICSANEEAGAAGGDPAG